ncbi:metal ABC transporter ATP-binding protein [Patescibacteria group bacterium]|nr:metal ABC transporter ATP-binding protein [Patescibacteria group bacterium]
MRSKIKKIISIANLFVKRGEEIILDDISAEITAGEIAAIIGPNGAGKTTLLKCLLGILPYKGEIKIFGSASINALDKIGYVPQRFSFDRSFPLTVREFLSLSAKNKNNIERALKEVEMEQAKNKLLGELSGGQLQRVLIARATMNDPEILLLDEPTSGIDVGAEKNFYEMILHQNKKHGCTIVLISHEVNMVYKYATQVICLNKNMLCMGAPEQAITKEIMSKLYGDSSTMTTHPHHSPRHHHKH